MRGEASTPTENMGSASVRSAASAEAARYWPAIWNKTKTVSRIRKTGVSSRRTTYSPAIMDLGRMGDRRWPSGKYFALRCTDLYRPAVRRMVAIW